MTVYRVYYSYRKRGADAFDDVLVKEENEEQAIEAARRQAKSWYLHPKITIRKVVAKPPKKYIFKYLN